MNLYYIYLKGEAYQKKKTSTLPIKLDHWAFQERIKTKLMKERLLSYWFWLSHVSASQSIKFVHPSSLTFFFSLLLLPFILSQTFFGHVRCKKKMQEGGEEERKDSSEGIWLVLIWKYCLI